MLILDACHLAVHGTNMKVGTARCGFKEVALISKMKNKIMRFLLMTIIVLVTFWDLWMLDLGRVH
jgi:hypothetical protein